MTMYSVCVGSESIDDCVFYGTADQWEDCFGDYIYSIETLQVIAALRFRDSEVFVCEVEGLPG